MKRPPAYREERAQQYLARSRRMQDDEGYRIFRWLLLIFVTVVAFAIWTFSTH